MNIWEFEVFSEHGYSAEELEQMSDYALQKFKSTNLENLRNALAGKQARCDNRSFISCISSIQVISVECSLICISMYIL